MADDSENPLIKALPPATDYISYLTLVEYNLSKEQLPTLHKVLQDTTLTTNIGWDLVHLLLPLLPDSEDCLRDVAKLGNPREVVLKVTELLEEIGREEDENEDEDDEGPDDEDVEEGADSQATAKQTSSKTCPPSKITRFSALLSLLSILHPRIKTKYPSRFLSTSLQAILSGYTSPGLPASTICASAILDFTRQIAPGGSRRPTVPPRKSSSSIATLEAFQNTQRANQSLSSGSAPDPEANTDGVDAGEDALQRRLLQSFMTYVAEVYLSRMPDDTDEDAPGTCWAGRYMEMVQPKRVVPGRRTMADLFSDEDKPYHERDAVVGSILAQSRDLCLSPTELLTTIIRPPEPSNGGQTEGHQESTEDDTKSTLPSSPSDVPLSTAGALYILTATFASPILFHRHHDPPAPSVELPSYPTLLHSLLPEPTSPILGTEPPAFLDALFFLGLYILNSSSSPSSSSTQSPPFPTEALQQLTLLSSRLPSPSQRYVAHTLASAMLHHHPDPSSRLGYIRDTLQHCPYENVRAEAVGWLKDSIVRAANNKGRTDDGDAGKANTRVVGGDEATTPPPPTTTTTEAAAVFLTPTLLPDLRPYLFPPPTPAPAAAAAGEKEGEVEEGEESATAAFQAMQPFHVAVLNLVFLIFSSGGDVIRGGLNAGAMEAEIRDWVRALDGEVEKWERWGRSDDGGGGGGGGGMDGMGGEMEIMRVNCAMCLEKLGGATP